MPLKWGEDINDTLYIVLQTIDRSFDFDAISHIFIVILIEQHHRRYFCTYEQNYFVEFSFQRDKTSNTFLFFNLHSFMKMEIITLKWRERERERYHLACNTACMRFFPASLHFLRIKKMPNFDFFPGIDVTTMSFLHLLI